MEAGAQLRCLVHYDELVDPLACVTLDAVIEEAPELFWDRDWINVEDLLLDEDMESGAQAEPKAGGATKTNRAASAGGVRGTACGGRGRSGVAGSSSSSSHQSGTPRGTSCADEEYLTAHTGSWAAGDDQEVPTTSSVEVLLQRRGNLSGAPGRGEGDSQTGRGGKKFCTSESTSAGAPATTSASSSENAANKEQDCSAYVNLREVITPETLVDMSAVKSEDPSEKSSDGEGTAPLENLNLDHPSTGSGRAAREQTAQRVVPVQLLKNETRGGSSSSSSRGGSAADYSTVSLTNWSQLVASAEMKEIGDRREVLLHQELYLLGAGRCNESEPGVEERENSEDPHQASGYGNGVTQSGHASGQNGPGVTTSGPPGGIPTQQLRTSTCQHDNDTLGAQRIFPTVSTDNPLFLRSAYYGIERPIDPESIRVMTFNVLCPEYALSNLARERLYATCPVEYLETGYRLPHCLSELYLQDADCYCLQEVSEEWYECGIKPLMESRYICFHKPKAPIENRNFKVTEGCAIFFRRSRFRVLQANQVSLSQRLYANGELTQCVQELDRLAGNLPGTKKASDVLKRVNSVAQLVLVEDFAAGQRLVVANTHLFSLQKEPSSYKPPAMKNIRMLQMLTVIREVEALVAKSVTTTGIRPRILICGDLNADPWSGVWELMLKKSVSPEHADWWPFDPPHRCNPTPPPEPVAAPGASSANAADAGTSTLASAGGATEKKSEGAALNKACTTSSSTSSSSASCSARGVLLAHSLNLQDAYAPAYASGRQATFGCAEPGSTRIIDYICCSQEFTCKRVKALAPKEQLCGPTARYPSDHIAIGMDLQY